MYVQQLNHLVVSQKILTISFHFNIISGVILVELYVTDFIFRYLILSFKCIILPINRLCFQIPYLTCQQITVYLCMMHNLTFQQIIISDTLSFLQQIIFQMHNPAFQQIIFSGTFSFLSPDHIFAWCIILPFNRLCFG